MAHFLLKEGMMCAWPGCREEAAGILLGDGQLMFVLACMEHGIKLLTRANQEGEAVIGQVLEHAFSIHQALAQGQQVIRRGENGKEAA